MWKKWTTFSHQLSVPHHNLTFGSRALQFSAPRVCNSLLVSIRKSQSLPTFRRHLKTFYFQSAYPLSAAHLARISLSMRPNSSKTLALLSCTYLLTFICPGLLARWIQIFVCLSWLSSLSLFLLKTRTMSFLMKNDRDKQKPKQEWVRCLYHCMTAAA